MLQIDVVVSESFDEDTQEFMEETYALKLEHSLLSLSKWESKYEKPFLSQDEKTTEEILDYIHMMVLGEDTPDEVLSNISNSQYNQINDYINAKRSATWFSTKEKGKRGSQTVTSELIYYWMTSYEIPWAAEQWHLSRLFTLIKIFNAERGKKEKPNRAGSDSIAAQRRALNEQRKKSLGTSG